MRIAVLISGGVDSSVALRILAERGGHEITAFYLKIWLEDELAHLGECPWEEDLAYARAVCETAGVPLKVLSLQAEYHRLVVRYALECLQAGGTPSPDIFCNRRVKFGAFLDLVGDGFDRVATGHYARIGRAGDLFLLKRAPDPVKDQTYFLCALRQDQLARALFPVGHLSKSEVRRLARRMGLPNRDRPDSQGICFLGRVRYDEFVRSYLGENPGPIVDGDSGRTLGRHRGLWFHTIGQRQGLGLGDGPWYVTGKDLARNVLVVRHRDSPTSRARDRFTVGGLHWIAGPPAELAGGARLQVRLRHGPRMADCTLRPAGEGRGAVALAAGDPGVAPGQFAVFYSGEVCLGGGTIETGPVSRVAAHRPMFVSPHVGKN